MIRAGIFSVVLLIMSATVASAGECGNLCDRGWWDSEPTKAEIAQEIATVDVNARDEDGNTPLHYAAFNGHTRVVKRLVAAGADRNATRYAGTCTPLDCAVTRRGGTVIRFLKACGAVETVRDPSALSRGCRSCELGPHRVW